MKKLKDQITKFVDENVQTINLSDIMSERFARYSKYIIQDRALPDARDGLKPVQRRILYAMQQMGMDYNKPYKKSARIAGEVMGKFHPHGDSSIYEAMVRLSQDFKMLVPLIDMHGNNGSIDGDPAAAMRYTEARLSKEASYLLKDIEKRTVNFVPNFDDEEVEPTVLPAKFPNLLVNGSQGISAGYATKIPPHNLEEVIDATIYLIDHPNASFDELADIIKGPDFPTGGIVQGKEGINQALQTGAGKVIIRAQASIEEISKSQDRIIITEIPYEVNKADLVRDIDTRRISQNISDILEVRDESDQEGLRIALDLKKGADANLILSYLYKNTNLQVSFNYNMVAILNNRPVLCGIIPLLSAYVEHQKEVVTNRSNFELEKALKRKHIVEGLIKMVSVLEEVIRIIRGSENKANSKENIIKAFGFSELQAEAIVTLQLYRLSNTDIIALQNEFSSLDLQIAELNNILSNEKVLLKLIKKELLDVKIQIGTPRRSVIEEEIENIKIDQRELISNEQVFLGVTKDGYIKKSSMRSFTQSKEVGLKENDSLMFEGEVNTLNTLIMFTSLGNYIFLPIYKLDDQKWRDIGIYVNNITPITKDEKIIKVLIVDKFNQNTKVLLASKKGMMKQINFIDLEVTRYNKPIRAMKLDAGDELVSVDTHALENIIALSKNGYVLRFKESELPIYGLTALGVRGMALNEGDQLACAFYAKDSDDFYFITSRGHLIKDSVYELPCYARYRKGIMLIERLKQNPHRLVDAFRYTKIHQKEDVKIKVIQTKGLIEIRASELKSSPNKFGVKVTQEALGDPLYLITDKIVEDTEGSTPIQTPKPLKVKEPNQEEVLTPPSTNLELSIKEEKVIENDQRKIRISRLDLFDDE